jgi:SSS family solute:Na+ symporter
VEAAATVTRLTGVDYLLMAIYFVAVLGVGWALRRRAASSSAEFLNAGRSLPRG